MKLSKKQLLKISELINYYESLTLDENIDCCYFFLECKILANEDQQIYCLLILDSFGKELVIRVDEQGNSSRLPLF